MKIHVVNLDRTPERLQEFLQLNAHLPEIVRFRAVDGLMLDLPAMARRGDIAGPLLELYTRGAIGNVMSHASLWSHAVATNQMMTICDDDTIFNHHFIAEAEALLARLPADWDWISWGWNFDAVMQMEFLPGTSHCAVLPDQDRMRAGVDVFQRQPVAPRAFRLRQAFGTPCYTISPKGARAFKALCWPIREMRLRLPTSPGEMLNVGIDVMVSNAYPKTRSYVSFPPLVITKNEAHKSTVQRPGGAV